jgi:UDP-N-acetylglucosamine 2-epimerase (non-hydrolysing)
MLKILIVAGARPNFMKVAPIIKAIVAHNSSPANQADQIQFRLVHTGQHYDPKMSGIFFQELGIPAPNINLDVGSGSHAVQTANVMCKFEPVCVEERPDWVVVVGDVNSTMACTLVCSKLGIKVAHVEAGLRSFDRTMPEEVNRLVTDALADLLLTPSSEAETNLRQEGVAPAKIRFVGNVMIDALIANLDKSRKSEVLKTNDLEVGNFVYTTLHRPSNVDEQASLEAIMKGLSGVAERFPVLFPVHPRTKKKLAEFKLEPKADSRVQLVDPVGYHDSLCLVENARLVLTDSGGLQEESTYFRTPCLTLRPNTERPVTLSLGSNRLTNPQKLAEDMAAALNGGSKKGSIPPLWDGRTAERIVRELIIGVGSSECR